MTWGREGLSGTRVIVLCALVGAVCVGLGVIIGWFSHTAPAPPVPLYTRDADPSVSEKLFASISTTNVRSNLREYTLLPHMAGTPLEAALEARVAAEWRAQGLDLVTARSYRVLLSFPNETDPSSVELLDGAGDIVYRSRREEEPVTPEQNRSDVPLPFNAYSPSGDVTAEMVYVHSATDEDFRRLRDELNINVTGKIVLARYGQSYRGDKVKFAAQYGAAAIVLYLDPITYNEGDTVFPDSQWLPGSAVQRGTILGAVGDPLTPNYPSTDSAYRHAEQDSPVLPTIPCHPIGYDDAYQFLSRLGGNAAPPEWQGGMNLTYRLGPGFIDPTWRVRVRVTTRNEQANATNLFAFINGTVEPDRYVLLGNHRDAWTFGGIDPTSGTALMLELSRTFMQLVREGWRPRRTIVFCSWGAEEHGLLGSTEWVEDYVKLLVGRAVAYLNVDYTMDGTAALTVGALPTLRDVLLAAAKKVASPRHVGRTVYDDWLEVFPSTDFLGEPNIDSLGDSSDFAGFLLAAGVACYDAWYTTKDNYGYPLYHTAYDGYKLFNDFMDPEYKFSLAVGQFWGETTRTLADSLLLPLNVSHYAAVLRVLVHQLDLGYGQLLTNRSISLDALYKAATEFQKAADAFHARLARVDASNPYVVRAINDQMMTVDRAFIDPAGLPLRPAYRHVVYAPSLFNSYAGQSFPGLTDLLYDIESAPDSSERWQSIRRHLATIIFCFESAAAAVRPVTDFMGST